MPAGAILFNESLPRGDELLPRDRRVRVDALAPAGLRVGADGGGRVRAVGMGPRYVISVTKNEARNEAGCYQNRIASHFNLAAGLCRAAISQF